MDRVTETTKRRTALAAAALALAGTGFWLWPQSRIPDGADPAASGKTNPREEKVVTILAELRKDLVRPDDPRRAERQAQLKDLKLRWDGLGLENASEEERHQLARESLAILSCSDELIDLIEYLDEKRLYDSPRLSLMVAKLFTSDQAAEARRMLATLVDAQAKTGTNYRAEWSFAAGKSTSAAEIDGLCSSLGPGAPGQEARLGYNLTLVQSDPLAAVQSTLAILAQPQTSPSKEGTLSRMMPQLAADADFEAIEMLFPQIEFDAPDAGPIHSARTALFHKWAAKDPAGAANYVIGNLGRFHPMLIEPIATAVLSQDLSAGVDWVEAFPAGAYRDYASLAAVRAVAGSDTAKAKEIAKAIGNAQIKQAAEDNIKAQSH